MKKIFEISLVLCFLILLLPGSPMQKGDQNVKEWPEVGSIYKYSGVDWYVRGVSKKAFEYTATGESLSLVVEGTPSSIVLVPKKGQVVRCDPTVPMIYVDKNPDPDLSLNAYFKRTAKNKVFLLLEYKRD